MAALHTPAMIKVEVTAKQEMYIHIGKVNTAALDEVNDLERKILIEVAQRGLNLTNMRIVSSSTDEAGFQVGREIPKSVERNIITDLKVTPATPKKTRIVLRPPRLPDGIKAEEDEEDEEDEVEEEEEEEEEDRHVAVRAEVVGNTGTKIKFTLVKREAATL